MSDSIMLSRRYRVLIVGDADTGKTHFFKKYICSEDCAEYISTIGVDFKEVPFGAGNAVQFWDTAGRESFRSITTSYFRGTKAFLLFFDVTAKKTFDGVRKWVELIKDSGDIILIGNKTDLEDREVTADMIRTLMEELSISSYHDISCKTGNGIDNLKFLLEKRLFQSGKYTEWEEPAAPAAPGPKKSFWRLVWRSVWGGKL
jgi:small GTP-binding protein